MNRRIGCPCGCEGPWECKYEPDTDSGRYLEVVHHVIHHYPSRPDADDIIDAIVVDDRPTCPGCDNDGTFCLACRAVPQRAELT